jgi:hypothetical protein
VSTGTTTTKPSTTTSSSSGGLHSVKLELGADVVAALQQLSAAQCGLVPMRVSDDNASILLAADESLLPIASLADLADRIDRQLPRFYAFARPGASPLAFFAMVIPADSPRKLRMVYSTAKAATADAVKARLAPALRLHAKLLEWDSDDLVEFAKAPDAFFKAATAAPAPAASAAAGGVSRAASTPARQVNSSAKNVVTDVHPVFQLLNNNNNNNNNNNSGSPTSTKVGKKVIIPPRSAW